MLEQLDDTAWLDVSLPLHPATVTFEGDLPVAVVRTSTMSGGDLCNITRIELGAHAGTHIDAPVHFIDGAGGVETIPIEVLIGPAEVVDARGIDGLLDRAATEALAIPTGTSRLLLRSRNSDLWDEPAFTPTFLGLTAGAAAYLVERGVRLVGIDYLSIAPFGDPTPTHRVLLGADVVVVEGLDLRGVEPGPYDLVCLPLRIPGSDGGPARTVIRRRPG